MLAVEVDVCALVVKKWTESFTHYVCNESPYKMVKLIIKDSNEHEQVDV